MHHKPGNMEPIKAMHYSEALAIARRVYPDMPENEIIKKLWDVTSPYPHRWKLSDAMSNSLELYNFLLRMKREGKDES